MNAFVRQTEHLCLCAWSSVYVLDAAGTVAACRYSELTADADLGKARDILDSVAHRRLRQAVLAMLRCAESPSEERYFRRCLYRNSLAHGLSRREARAALLMACRGDDRVRYSPTRMEISERITNCEDERHLQRLYEDIFAVSSESRMPVTVFFNYSVDDSFSRIFENGFRQQNIVPVVNILPNVAGQFLSGRFVEAARVVARFFWEDDGKREGARISVPQRSILLSKIASLVDRRRLNSGRANVELTITLSGQKWRELNPFIEVVSRLRIKGVVLPPHHESPKQVDIEGREYLLAAEECEKFLIRSNQDRSAVIGLYAAIPYIDEPEPRQCSQERELYIDIPASRNQAILDDLRPLGAEICSDEEAALRFMANATKPRVATTLVLGPALSSSRNFMNAATAAAPGANFVASRFFDLSAENDLPETPAIGATDVLLTVLKPTTPTLVRSELRRLRCALLDLAHIRNVSIVLTIPTVLLLETILEELGELRYDALRLMLPWSMERASTYPVVVEAAPLVHSALARHERHAKRLLPNYPIKYPWIDNEILAGRPREPLHVSVFQTEPLLSVIVPTYNKASSIDVTLRALSRQTIPKRWYEVVLVDDGSSDKTVEAISSAVAEFCRDINIAVFSWPRTRSRTAGDFAFRAGHCRNLGAEFSRGRWLLFLDGDMVPRDDLLEEHMRYLTKGAVVVRGTRIRLAPGVEDNIRRRLKSAPLTQHSSWPTEDIGMGDEPPPTRAWQHQDPAWKLFYTHNVSIHRDVFMEAGGFDESFAFWGCEDLDLGYRLWKRGVALHHNDHALAFHVHHDPEYTDVEGAYVERLGFECLYRKYIDFALLSAYQWTLSGVERETLSRCTKGGFAP